MGDVTGHGSAHAARQAVGKRGLWLYLALASTLALLLCLYFLVKGKAFAFVDIGSDTFLCFYPLQVAISKQLHQLQSITWSFDLGLGGFMGSLIDPLWLFTGWLPESWQLGMRLPMFVLRILVGGGFIYAYLRLLGFDLLLAVIGGLCYSFSSYGLTNAQWEVLHGTEYMQLAAYLYCLEHFLRTRRPWTAVAAGIVVGLGHPLGLYMFALLSVIYFSLKLAGSHREEWKSMVGSLLKFAAWCVLGILLTAPLLLPEIYYLFESPRISGDYANFHTLFGAVFSINDSTIVATEAAGLLGKDLLGNAASYHGWGNYFEAPGFYVGLLPLLAIPQLLGPRANRRERAMCVAGMALVLFYFLFPALRFLVYGFGHFSFRFSTLWIAVVLLVLGLSGLRRLCISGLWVPGLGLSVAGILCIPLTAMVAIPGFVNIEHVVRICAFLGLYATVLVLMCRSPNGSPRAVLFLLSATCCELLLFAMPQVIQRDAVGTDGTSTFGRYNDGTQQALALIRDHDTDGAFYRIEKTFDSVFLDDALVQGYSGTKSYYFHAASVTRFVDHLGLPRPLPSSNYISSMAARREILNLVGVRYLLARDRALDSAPDMTYVGSAGGLFVFKNAAAFGFATLLDSIEAESSIDKLPAAARDKALLRTLAVEDPDKVIAQIGALNRLNRPQPDLSSRTQISKLSDISLTGQVQSPTASALLLSMPFDRGWSARLDGRGHELFRADFGLSAMVVPSGSHKLELDYRPPGREAGKWLSIATLLMLLSIAVLDRLRKNKSPGVADLK